MRKTSKYRLFPTRSKRRIFQDTLDHCRYIYNRILETRRDAWQDTQETLYLYDTVRLLPIWKREQPELKSVYSQVYQDVCARVDLAFQAFSPLRS